jgi:GntR family transcriptional regulator/MocR family aminotransferase
VPTSQQAVVASFIEEGHFASHIRRMRKLYAERQEVLLEAAGARLAGMLDLVRSESGFQTIGHLAPALEEQRVADAAAERGVTVTPIRRFCLEPVAMRGLVLGFSACQPREIRAGVATLGEILESSLAAGGRASASAGRR